jgi:glycosyltransferase involved in cell wall biosynthesis
MRITLVGPLPPPSGGMANQTLQLARLLALEGMDVDMVQVNEPCRPAWVGKIRGVRAVFRLVPYLARLWRSIGRADVVHLMANSGWSWHFFAVPAIWVGWFRRVPVVVNYRGGYAREFLSRQSRLVAFTMGRASCLMVPSKFLEKVFTDFDMRSRVVPNIVDINRFSSSGDVFSRPPVILVARNLEPIYDNSTAICALAALRKTLPQARLVIAGSGGEETSLRRLAVDMGQTDHVEFVGRVASEDMPGLYSNAAVVLNPSLVDNMPNSVLEAFAAGVPVVSTNVGGVPYMVQEGRNALLVKPGDAEAMATALLRVLGDKNLAKRLSVAGRETAAQYDWPQIRARLFSIYDEVARGRLAGAAQ